MVATAPAAFAEWIGWSRADESDPPRHAVDEIFEEIVTHLGKSSVSVTRRDIDAMTDAAVFGYFASLGDNCEFGIVQRACGAEAAGLFAFARTPLDALMEVLSCNLDRVSDPSKMRLIARPTAKDNEYLLINDLYGIVYHISGERVLSDPNEIMLSESKRLRLLEDDLRKTLADAKRIFVIKCNDDLTEDEARAVLEGLEGYGRNALLYVVQANSTHSSGSVLRVSKNLYRGYLDAFAPYSNAYASNILAWKALCRGTLRLHFCAASGR